MSTGKRAVFIGTYELQRLDHIASLIDKALDTPYLVGSANAKADYRDVDVRVLLPDAQFDSLFKTKQREDGQRLWALICYAITGWLRAETGLPIDFQIQRRTEANKKFGGQSRNPLGGRGFNFAAYGDATNLWPRDKKARAAYLKPQKRKGSR